MHLETHRPNILDELCTFLCHSTIISMQILTGEFLDIIVLTCEHFQS